MSNMLTEGKNDDVQELIPWKMPHKHIVSHVKDVTVQLWVKL